MFLVIQPLPLIVNALESIPLNTLDLSLIANPHTLIDFAIDIKILAFSLFHSFNQLALVSFALSINIHAIAMIEVMLPIAHVNIALLSFIYANTVSDTILGNLAVVSGVVLKLNCLNIGKHAQGLLEGFDFCGVLRLQVLLNGLLVGGLLVVRRILMPEVL